MTTKRRCRGYRVVGQEPRPSLILVGDEVEHDGATWTVAAIDEGSGTALLEAGAVVDEVPLSELSPGSNSKDCPRGQDVEIV